MEKILGFIKNIIKPLTYKYRNIRFEVDPPDAKVTLSFEENGKKTSSVSPAREYLDAIEKMLSE